jgi:acyl carrier protein
MVKGGHKMEEKKETLKKFLSRFFRKHELKDDEDIFLLGFVNSLFSMQLVMFLESEFKIKVENEDLDLNNFRTINSIVSFVESKVKVN